MRNPCVAHRGWSGRAPENTLAAIRLAMSEPDLYWIEIDVQLSKDGVPVVIHDYNLKRTTNGRGEVKDWTAAELASLDAGGWFSSFFKGEHIPTLEEVLQATCGRCRLNIELKTDGIRYPAIENRVLELIYAYKLEHDAVITSFHSGTLHKVRALTQDVRTGLILDAWRPSLPQELKAMGASFLSIGYSRLNRERMQLLRQADIQVMAWTLNDARTISKVAGLDSELMICTNYPDRWRDAVLKLV
ncbi:glycerophosphodiester phosphodiesterase [Paenibacillus sp. GCM10023252]|uniref:glycerophosphodiester phosphodiesterase n=1 Tax=Paenibacillus sp. GCM10023252 TaxID=3252649 RepID=UPI00361E1882